MISQNKFLAKYLFFVYTAFITATILIVDYLLPSLVYHNIWVIVLFFFLLTLGSITLTKYIAKHWKKQFVHFYFAIMTVRLLVSVGFALIFIVFDRQHVILFGINFLVLYFLFLGFEIYTILTNLRTHFKKGIGND